MTTEDVYVAAKEILEEYSKARIAHGPMRSVHEGYGVLIEEVDELWDEIKKKNPDKVRMRAEAKQVAAMALAFMIEQAQ